jgi:hypothetical protein
MSAPASPHGQRDEELAEGRRRPIQPRLMPRRLLLLATCAAAACSASTGSRHVERAELSHPAVDSVPIRPAAVDLSGAWATGSANEPAAPRVVLRLECNYSPSLWVIQQTGDLVRAWAIPESRAQGILSTQPVRTAAAEGQISGVDLTMRIADARYVLRYDSTSGHLRGTLNGAPFWAVRQDLVRAEGCIAVP